MTLKDNMRAWLGVDKPRAVPRRIDPRDSVTVITTGDVGVERGAAFAKAIDGWREGTVVLFLTEGSRIELTRRDKS